MQKVMENLPVIDKILKTKELFSSTKIATIKVMPMVEL